MLGLPVFSFTVIPLSLGWATVADGPTHHKDALGKDHKARGPSSFIQVIPSKFSSCFVSLGQKLLSCVTTTMLAPVYQHPRFQVETQIFPL